ncbi:2-hydroxyacyl-CoA dehydratase subunit D [Chloroflexota bacterium]
MSADANKILDKFTTVAQNPGNWINNWKAQTQKKVIGCFPMYVTEEIIHAAGLLPVYLLGSDEPIGLAANYFHQSVCHPIRSNLDAALRGQLDFLDGLIIADVCEQVKRGADLWLLAKPTPFFFKLRLPGVLNASSHRSWLLQELGRLRSALEHLTGSKISDDSLRNSITIYNQHRSLLKDLYERRREGLLSLNLAQLEKILIAAMFMPKEEHVELLFAYLKVKSSEPVAAGPRLLIWGNPCENLEPGLCEAIEAIGGVVVDDYIHTGARYFSSQLSQGADPLEVLAATYTRSLPCPTKYSTEIDVGEHLLQLAHRSKAQGVIISIPKYCEIFASSYPRLKQALQKEGIPHLLLESDHSGASAQIRTRVQAFVEILEANGAEEA